MPETRFLKEFFPHEILCLTDSVSNYSFHVKRALQIIWSGESVG